MSNSFASGNDRFTLSSMTLNQLRYFVSVADLLHFGRAAEALKMSQPALSQQIVRLERALGVALFVRNSRRVSLTGAGAALLGRARRALAESERGAYEARRVAAGSPNQLRIGYFAPNGLVILPRAAQRLASVSADIAITPVEGYTPFLIDRLRAGLLDAVIARGPVVAEGLRSEVLRRERLVAVLPAAHPLARQRAVKLSSLADEGFVRCPRGTAPPLYDAVNAACEDAGFAPRTAMEVTDWPAILSFVAGGQGIGMLSECITYFRRAGCVYRRIQGATPRLEVAVVWPQGGHSAALGKALDAIRYAGGSTERA